MVIQLLFQVADQSKDSDKTVPLTPNTRKRKSVLATRLTNTTKDFNLHNKDLVDVVTLYLKQIGILDSIKENRVPTKLGRKQLSYDLWKKNWGYWHNNATTSTFTRVASTPGNSWNLLEMGYTPGKTSWKIKKTRKTPGNVLNLFVFITLQSFQQFHSYCMH